VPAFRSGDGKERREGEVVVAAAARAALQEPLL
jgi:hypothetical protein